MEDGGATSKPSWMEGNGRLKKDAKATMRSGPHARLDWTGLDWTGRADCDMAGLLLLGVLWLRAMSHHPWAAKHDMTAHCCPRQCNIESAGHGARLRATLGHITYDAGLAQM